MIAMHMTLSGRLVPVLGMFALLGMAVAVGVGATLYAADWVVYLMHWVSDFLYNAELMFSSLLHAVGLTDDISSTYYSFAREKNAGVFAGGLYIATEVLYLVAVVVVATRAAVETQTKSVKSTAPKKSVSLYLLLNIAYTVAFFYWIMFDLQYARNYQEALLGPLREQANSLSSIFIATWSWKLVLFIPLQLALIIGVWRNSPWFKTLFASYLLFDVAYYGLLTGLTTSSHSGLFVSIVALLLFTPYLLTAKRSF
ncbi:hypothetical protein [Idiomarina sp.]|uniref:hypothetical protein n=1 Tax=Idiomarina sp. TaxID=1874361 RepID=UPI003518A4C7